MAIDGPPEWDGIPANRPAAEYWIASHPDMRPCDLYDGHGKPTWVIKNTPTSDWEEEIRTAPRYPVQYWVNNGRYASSIDHPNYLVQKSFKYKMEIWNRTYGVKPAADHWSRKYYMD